ncbi:MAG: hypothetical protein JNM36_15020 [Chitinophagales bacterium]|nr:hypothetical protein [Chitinophagales bacterium]HNL06185.1 hypothetical protein [Chitinophagales bacterium]
MVLKIIIYGVNFLFVFFSLFAATMLYQDGMEMEKVLKNGHTVTATVTILPTWCPQRGNISGDAEYQKAHGYFRITRTQCENSTFAIGDSINMVYWERSNKLVQKGSSSNTTGAYILGSLGLSYLVCLIWMLFRSNNCSLEG